MERSKVKEWVKPVLDAMPSRKVQLIVIGILLCYLVFMTPILNKWMYPLEYEEYIFNSAKQYDTDPYLIMSVIRVETKFDPEEQSRVGAKGLMQIMPSTMDWAITSGNFSLSMKNYIHDPATNIQVGSWYLSFLMKRYNGNKVAATAAYNAGQGNVDKWLREKIWDGTRQNADQIPFPETRDYVERVSYYYDKYKDLYGDLSKKYNFNQ